MNHEEDHIVQPELLRLPVGVFQEYLDYLDWLVPEFIAWGMPAETRTQSCIHYTMNTFLCSESIARDTVQFWETLHGPDS